jgi:hypothetical protein
VGFCLLIEKPLILVTFGGAFGDSNPVAFYILSAFDVGIFCNSKSCRFNCHKNSKTSGLGNQIFISSFR